MVIARSGRLVKAAVSLSAEYRSAILKAGAVPLALLLNSF